MAALDEEDLYDDELSQLLNLPPPGEWSDDGEPPMERLEVQDSFSVGNDPARRPLEAKPPAPSGGPAISGPGFDQQRTQAPAFDWRRAIVAAGKGDVRQYDANKLRREQAPALDEQRRATRARLDPMSPESKQAQDDFAAQLRMYSQIPGLPDGIRGELDAQAANVGRLSASQVERATLGVQRLLGSALRGAGIEGVATRAQQGHELRVAEGEQRARERAQRLGLDWAQLTEQQRHNLATEANADPAVKVQHKLPVETTLRQYRDRSVALKQIKRLRELLPKVRYLGAGADNLNALLSQAPGGLDVRTPEEREFASLIKRLRAPERKNIFGAALSKFDIKDSEGFMAGLTNNREQLMTNLGTLEEALMAENEMVAEQYPSMSGEAMPGAPTRPAARPRAKSPASAAPSSGSMPAPAGAPPGALIEMEDGKRYRVSKDGKTITPE